MKVCPWVSFALLKFAINDGTQLISFYSWLIDHKQYHHLLYFILNSGKGKVLSDGDNKIDLIS